MSTAKLPVRERLDGELRRTQILEAALRAEALNHDHQWLRADKGFDLVAEWDGGVARLLSLSPP